MVLEQGKLLDVEHQGIDGLAALLVHQPPLVEEVLPGCVVLPVRLVQPVRGVGQNTPDLLSIRLDEVLLERASLSPIFAAPGEEWPQYPHSTAHDGPHTAQYRHYKRLSSHVSIVRALPDTAVLVKRQMRPKNPALSPFSLRVGDEHNTDRAEG